jgi:hypothetical protein
MEQFQDRNTKKLQGIDDGLLSSLMHLKGMSSRMNYENNLLMILLKV